MKLNLPSFFRTALLLAVTGFGLAQAQAEPASKVRVMVSENNISSTPGSGTLGSGAGAATPPVAGKPAGQPGKSGAATPAASASFTADMQAYTHTTKKSLTIQVVNVTNDPIDVTVKATFLGKDEVGKHEVAPESTLEKKLTIQPGKPESYTTEEVSFTHTTAHRGAAPKGKPAAMEPASGHSYFGYKVEVLQGSDVVGSAVSANH
jgi:hypothetical protein